MMRDCRFSEASDPRSSVLRGCLQLFQCIPSSCVFTAIQSKSAPPSPKEGIVFITHILSLFNVRHSTADIFVKASKDDPSVAVLLPELIADLFGLHVDGFQRKILHHVSSTEGIVHFAAIHFNFPVNDKSSASVFTLVLRILAAAGPDLVAGFLRLQSDAISAVEISAQEQANTLLRKLQASPVSGDSCMQLVRKYFWLRDSLPALCSEHGRANRKWPPLQDSDQLLKLQAECVAEVAFWQWAAAWYRARDKRADTGPDPVAMSFQNFNQRIRASTAPDHGSLSAKVETLLRLLEPRFVIRHSCGSLFDASCFLFVCNPILWPQGPDSDLVK